ncbi:MMPL family RND transporter [Mycobacterium decipiens]|uniref:MMPL family RND transporter n=1 Tax=Mycobacterium decipiens TaxID=1430326 RepID=A0A1X2LY28_9MYCO|nr:MMPL family RND transporter [Mycobacterium decipiens]
MWERITKITNRHAVLIVGLWVIAAAVGNLFVPQVESTARSHERGFLPADAPVSIAGARMGAQFQDGNAGNINYLVLESDHRLGPPERAYYNQLLAKLRADPTSLASATDLWSDPLTAKAALSNDGKAEYTMLRLAGDLGSAQANSALDTVRRIVASQPTPLGLHAYVTGPGATVADELSAIDKQMLLLTGVTVVLIALLLLGVYRSVITAAIPLLAVGLGLAVGRSIVSLLGEHNLVEVSIFSVALLGAMVLGGATDYAIFLIGRYHEARRDGAGHEQALLAANRNVMPVILASALTLAAALSCLTFADVGMLRSAGLPCAIGILTGMLASLTLLPALLGLAGRHGLAQPRDVNRQARRRWRRIGTMVARWPGPVLVAAALVLLICTLPIAGLRLGFDEPAAQPDSTRANRGYQAADRHFPPNQLLPEIVSIESDRDLRNPAGVIAIERVTRKLMETPGIRMVQSASRPAGSIPEEATFTNQAGAIGDQLDVQIDQLDQRLAAVDQIAPTLARFSAAISRLQDGLSGSVNGLGRVNSNVDVMGSGLAQLHDTAAQVSGYLDPLRDYTNSNPNCSNDPICSLVLKVVAPTNSIVAETNSLTLGASQLGAGISDAAKALATADQSAGSMRADMAQLSATTEQLAGAVGDTHTAFSSLIEYLRGVRQDFQGSGEGTFYLPQRAWNDPRFQRAANLYFSPGGQVTRLLIYGNGAVFGADGANRSPQIVTAVKEATKDGVLAGSTVDITGFGTATAQLRGYVHHDFVLLAAAALALVFLIVLVMLRSPVAAAVVIGAVIVSYLSALGISTLIWHDLLGKDLHWAVQSMALISLVAVGADYNLLLTMRVREEVFTGSEQGARLRTAMIRAFGGAGGVVTTAGIVFGITMFAMASSDVLSIEQVGTTIGVGLVIDTLVVRIFAVPAIVGLLGRWFWWSPPAFLLRPLLNRWRGVPWPRTRFVAARSRLSQAAAQLAVTHQRLRYRVSPGTSYPILHRLTARPVERH